MTPDMKSRDQEKLYHSIIGQIAKQSQLHGSRWNQESWKRFLIDQWAHESGEMRTISKVMPSIDGERVVQLGHQSRRFTKEQAISCTEWLIYWATTNGVTLEERREEA
jgi:hypothetical protein